MKILFLACACLGLLACAHHPATRAGRATVPPGRRFDSSLLKPSATRSCAVTIVREPGVRGSGLNLYLDGDELARIASGEAITAYLKPGRHLLAARPLFSPVAVKRLFLEKGDKVAIRIIDQDGNFELRTADRAWLDSIGKAYQSLLH